MKDVASLFREYMRLDRKSSQAGLTPAELQRWTQLKRRLCREFTPGLDSRLADRRASVRVPLRLAVSFHDLGELRRSLMTNLSRRGVFVAAEDPPEIGMRLQLRLHIEETGKEITVETEVVSQNVGPGLLPGQRGMGLRFVDLDAAAEREISELYERQLERAVVRAGDGS